jgi:integrase
MAKCSPSTSTQYRKRAKDLIQRYLRERDIGSGPFSPTEFAEWLVTLKAGLRSSSWRQYRAAVIYYAEEEGTEDDRWPDAVSRIQTNKDPCPRKKHLPARTSAQKAKHLSERDLERLIARLLDGRSIWGRSAAVWLLAGRLTGLREIEWQQAEWLPGNRLMVANAKATQGRANGPERLLHLGSMSEVELGWINEHMTRTRRHVAAGTFERFRKACQKRVAQTSRSLWPRRKRWPTLYTIRHQVAADAKAAGFDRDEVAALLGHASVETAGRHYGKKRSGNGRSLTVLPDAGDVLRVRERCNPLPPELDWTLSPH